jgi:ADP-ribose pyrophosphatase YjhB (NUDIX family)
MPSWYRDPDAPEPNVPRKIGVTALIRRNEAFLVERRADDADVWAFIGGTLEDGEPLLDALAREVREETGFEIEAARLLGLFSDPSRLIAYPDGTVCRVLSIAFLVTVLGVGEPRTSSESAGMCFVSRDELASLPFWPAQRPIRAALLDDPVEPIVA